MKKVLSLVLAFVMLFSLTIPSVWAETGAVSESATTTNGHYDQEGNWKPDVGDGTVTVENPTSGTNVKLSKTVAPTEVDNEFEITMSVETAVTFNTSATVLVMDVSGSMACCAECGREYEHDAQCTYNNSHNPWQGSPVEDGQTRIAAAKEAAKAFLKKYRGEPSDVGRYVSIVAFSDTVHEKKVSWLDLSKEADYREAVNLVENLTIGGATNLDAGLHRADELLRTDSVARNQKNVIVLTDGEPTFCCNGGDGEYGSQKINEETAATAKLLQKDAFLYTICFSAENKPCFAGGPTVGEFLREDIASPFMGEKEYAYSADNTVELQSAFDRIAESVVSGANGGDWEVYDPMGPFITVKEAPDYVSVSEDGKLIQGKLTRPQISEEKGSTTYTYKLTYRITLDTNAEGFEEDAFYPANGRTYVIDRVKDRAEFPVPGVKGKLPYFTVTYNQGDHGQLAGQNADGNVVHPDLKKHTATPAGPAVTAEEGYYFTGWQPAVTPTVTRDITYVARYAPKHEITVEANSAAVTYNGQEQSVAGFKQTEFEIDGKIYSVEGLTASAVGTNAGEYVSKVTGTPVVKCDGRDVSEQFIVTTIDGKLEVTQRPVDVAVVGNTEVKAHNGTEQAVKGYTVSVSDPLYEVEDIRFTGEAVAKGTDVGTYSMGLDKGQFSNTDPNFRVSFSVKDGSLQITPVDAVVVTITGHKDSQIYNGTEQSVTGCDVKISNPLYKETDFTFAGDATSKGTNVGVYPMGLKPENFKNANANFENVVFEVTDGTLEITPRQVELVSGSGSKTYDGQPLENHEITVRGEGFVGEEGVTCHHFASITNKGSVENTFAYTPKENTSLENYDITMVPGTLTVDAINQKLQVWAASDRRVYNGEPLMNSGYTYTDGILAESDKLIAEVNGSALHVGDAGVNEVGKVTIYNKDSEDVTANYANITKKNGELTVTPRSVTIISDSATKAYDGKALTAETVTYDGEGFVGEEGVECTNFASITDVGTRKNTFRYTWKDGTKNSDYVVKMVEGKLEITKRPVDVTIVGNSDVKVFNGAEQSVTGYTVSVSDPLYKVEDIRFAGGAVAKGTDVGTYSMGLDKGQFSNTDPNFAVTFSVKDGSLQITPVDAVVVTITGHKDSGMYNGTEQSVTGYDVKISNPLYKETDFTFAGDATAKGTNVGTYAMGLKAEDFENTNANFENVVFEVTDGALEITERKVELVSGSGSKTYDGQPLENHEITVKGDGFVDGEGATYHDFVSITDVGQTKNTFRYTLNENTKADNYNISVVEGNLEILPVDSKLVITAASASKMYDSTALTNNGYTYTDGILAEGDKLIAIVEGSATNVTDEGINHVVSCKVMRGDTDVTANYTGITTEDGKLTITPRDVTLTSNSASKIYDGTPLTAETVSVSGSGFVDGEGATYHDFASITDAGQTENTFRYTLNENAKADNYTIAVVNGWLSVNKCIGAKLEAEGYTGIYDSADHDGVSDKQIVGGVNSDEWKYTYSMDGETFVPEMPQFKDVGTYTVYVKATNDNYEGDALITAVPVEITPAVITVTADSHTVATGDADPELTYQVDMPVATETPAFSGELVRDVGNTKGVYTIKQGTLALMDGDRFKASNYTLVYVSGELTILQRALDITKTVDKTKVCVGDELVYTIIVTNTGDVDLENVLLVDEMLHVQENIGELGVGKSVTRQYTYVVTEEDEGTQLVNTAVVTADGGTTNEGDSEATRVESKAPETGDDCAVQLWMMSTLVSAAGLVVLGTQRKKFMHKG